jgi:hypothetical protein
MIFSRPFHNAQLHFVSFLDALGRTCRVFPPESILERAPEMPYEKPSYWCEKIIYEVPLVAMEQKNPISDHNRLMDLQIVEKAVYLGSGCVQIPLQPFFISHLKVMIPEDIAQPVFLMKNVQKTKYVPMGFNDVRKPVIFVQFISVAQLDIGVFFFVVEIESIGKNKGIMPKIVGPISQPPVEIAEDHVFVVYGQVKYFFVVCEGFIQSGGDSDETHELRYFFDNRSLHLAFKKAGNHPHILVPKIVGPLYYMSSLALLNKTFRLKGFAIRNIPPRILLQFSSSFLIRDDKKIIGIFCVEGSFFKIHATSLPSISGIKISRMIKSGWSFLAISIASYPPEARRT